MVDDIEGPDYVKAVHHLDAEVKIENKQISDQQRVIVNRNGILRLQTMLKISVSGCYNQQTQGILTLCYNHINKLNLIDLFSLLICQH